MIAAFARLFVLAALFIAQRAAADALPLPTGLTDLRSPQGEALLLESHALAAYFPISVAFETQKNQAYCGVASIVMVLNAIHAPAPASPEYQPYNVFTQDNVLDERTDAILPREVLARQGMTLDQLGQILSLYPVAAEVRHAAPGGLDEFRKTASEYLASKDHFVVVNYLRKTLGQERGGHISPLAAYDDRADRFLVLDVARYKYPPVWVATSDLFDAMNTVDSANSDKTRGYVLISAKSAGGEAPAQ
jgi:Phytochelatin synthase